MRGKKLLCLLLAGVLCFGSSFTSQASSASEAKKEAEAAKEKADEAKEKSEELAEQKQQAETEKKSLSIQLDTLLTEMTELEGKINAKEEEITLKEEELIQARVDENDQYESMKKRIKYMYENCLRQKTLATSLTRRSTFLQFPTMIGICSRNSRRL